MTKIVINNPANASASGIAQQANFWDPPSKNEQNSNFTANEATDNLLKYTEYIVNPVEILILILGRSMRRL